MRIETNYDDKHVAFKEIEQGQVFMYEGDYYLKTDPVLMASDNHVYHANAVRLKDGTNGYVVLKHEVVTKINAKVMVEE